MGDIFMPKNGGMSMNEPKIYNGKPVLTQDTFDYSTVKVGDYVEQAVVDNAMDCLPPACMTSQCSQLGEPYSHREDPDTGKWRPIAYATKTMIDLLPDPRLVGAILDGENNAYAYRIESKPDGEEVIIAFSAVERQPITIPWDSDRALLTDMYGHDEPVAVEGGSLTFEGGAYPVYIRHIHQ